MGLRKGPIMVLGNAPQCRWSIGRPDRNLEHRGDMKRRRGAIMAGRRPAPWLFDPRLAGCSLVLKAEQTDFMLRSPYCLRPVTIALIQARQGTRWPGRQLGKTVGYCISRRVTTRWFNCSASRGWSLRFAPLGTVGAHGAFLLLNDKDGRQCAVGERTRRHGEDERYYRDETQSSNSRVAVRFERLVSQDEE